MNTHREPEVIGRGQGHEFVSAIERVGGTTKDAQSVINSAHLAQEVLKVIRVNACRSVTPTKEEEDAISILGKGHVVTVSEADPQWGVDCEIIPPILFSRNALIECARDNEAGITDWWLVFVSGYPLSVMVDIRGRDKKNMPSLQVENLPWMPHRDSAKPGYCLLDLKPQFANMTWDAQEVEITNLGKEFARAYERDVVEVVLTIFLTSGLLLLNDRGHWGYATQGAFGARVMSHDYQNAVSVTVYGNLGRASAYERVGVVIMRHPDR